MIPFFRKIRKKMADDNKPLKYMRYALGEIFLLVIGILIALSINNWNHQQNRQGLKENYILSIKKDLEQDIFELNAYSEAINKSLKNLKNLKNRLQNPSANIDTLIQIARYEFNPNYIVAKRFNNNTFNSLISTGNIDLLDFWVNETLLDLNTVQILAMDGIKSNYGVYNNVVIKYISRYSYNNTVMGKIDGFIDDNIWDSISENELSSDFSSILLTKITMYQHILDFQNKVLILSLEFREKLNKY
jgi:hypothetical protein